MRRPVWPSCPPSERRPCGAIVMWVSGLVRATWLRCAGRALGRGERRANEIFEGRRIEVDDVLLDLVAVDAQAVDAAHLERALVAGASRAPADEGQVAVDRGLENLEANVGNQHPDLDEPPAV